LVGVALAPGLAVLALALAVMAAANSVVDVAMNAQGVELERRYRRPVLSSLHAGHSGGLLVGSVAGTAAAAAKLSLHAHFAVTAVLGVLLGQVAARWLVDEPTGTGRPTLVRPGRPLLLLGAVAFCGFLLDGAAYNWSAVHVHTTYHAAPALAAAAFTAVAGALALGRLASDGLIAALGRARVVQVAGATTAAGGALAVAAPTAVVSIAGWALFGLGLAAIGSRRDRRRDHRRLPRLLHRAAPHRRTRQRQHAPRSAGAARGRRAPHHPAGRARPPPERTEIGHIGQCDVDRQPGPPTPVADALPGCAVPAVTGRVSVVSC
jgi:hypothetical protein